MAAHAAAIHHDAIPPPGAHHHEGPRMKNNVGATDRHVRIVLGVLLLSFAALSSHPLHLLGLIGIVPLVTAALRVCPLYSLLGISTCPVSAPRG
jgi:hypothetical protein